ncbi:hypothetical protein D3C76_685720 [compost metagenome]
MRQPGYGFEFFDADPDFADVDQAAAQLMDDDAGDGGGADLQAVLRVTDQTPGDVHGEGEGQEFLQLAESAELSQHQLAENHLAQRRPDRRIQRVEQHAQRERDEREVFHRELDRPEAKLGDKLGEHVGQAVQGHGEDENHHFLRGREGVQGFTVHEGKASFNESFFPKCRGRVLNETWVYVNGL